MVPVKKFILASAAVLAVLSTSSVTAVRSNQSLEGKRYNGSVLDIKFTESAAVTLNGSQFTSQTGYDLSAVNAVLQHSKTQDKKQLFDQSKDTLRQERAKIQAETGSAVPDLSSYYRVRLHPGLDSQTVAQNLKSLSGVAEAYAEPLPISSPVTPDFSGLQIYMNGAPDSMNVNAASSFPGVRGGYVRLADVEYSWNTSHEDLSKSRAAGAKIVNGTPVDPFANNTHGTAVLGIISGDRNSFGINGIVPNATLHLVNAYNNERGWDLPNSIYTASNKLSAGDVMLIEQQTYGPAGYGFVPVEWVPAVYDAIRTATAKGVVVVEAAGNGGVNLDDPVFGSSFPAGKVDSGAIIVGAGTSCSGTIFRTRKSFSNYGNRVNVQGHGECVTATGYGDLFYGGVNADYTRSFDGTSSASALIASVAAAVSSSYENLNAKAATPAFVRSTLVSTGSPQVFSGGLSGKIGPLPNLLAAVRKTDLKAPSVPGGLSVSLNSNNKPVVKWSAATDNVGVSTYRVFRNGTQIATTGSLTYTDTSAAKNTSYTYKIQAVDASSNASALSGGVTIKTRP